MTFILLYKRIINTVIEKRFQEKEIESLIEIKDNDRYELDWKSAQIAQKIAIVRLSGQSSLVERLFLKGTVYRDGSDFTS
ncbi:unnamed protein product [Rhizophagus irregularis]|nr:unnamed protein product [Rhizophagus irregularis]